MKHILIIDDDKNMRAFLRLHLSHAGYDVSEAEDGEAGLHMLGVRRAELVIVDIFMPHKDGLETILELRAQGAGCKIVAVSAGTAAINTGLNFLNHAKEFGADAILAKPLAKETLLPTVASLIGNAD
ncbi:MAG: response regulator transcription factor [Desulfovibrionaceae bacterium]